MTRNESFYTLLEQLSPREITGHFIAETSAGFINPSYIHYYAAYRFDDVFLGHGDLDVNMGEKQIRWGKFYPHDEVDLQRSGRRGIGTLAHVSILLGINNLITHATQIDLSEVMVTHDNPLEDRTTMLERMNIDPTSPLIFTDYLARSLKYAKQKGIDIDVLERRLVYGVLTSTNDYSAFVEAATSLNRASEVTFLDPEDHLVHI